MTVQEPMQMLRDVVIRGFARWADSLPDVRYQNTRFDRTIIDVTTARNSAVRLWNQAEEAVDDAATQAPLIRSNPDLSAEAKQRQISALVATQGGIARDAVTELRSTLDATADRLRSALLPARPEPADATQEAALGNVRTDLAMLLDRLPTHDLVGRIGELVKEAHASGDTLTRWFLTATPWAERYLEARGVNAAEWKAMKPTLLSELGDDPDETRQLLGLLEAIESPRGMLGAVAGLDHWARTRLDEIGRG